MDYWHSLVGVKRRKFIFMFSDKNMSKCHVYESPTPGDTVFVPWHHNKTNLDLCKKQPQISENVRPTQAQVKYATNKTQIQGEKRKKNLFLVSKPIYLSLAVERSPMKKYCYSCGKQHLKLQVLNEKSA